MTLNNKKKRWEGGIVIYNPTKNPIKLEENRCSSNAYTFYKNNYLKQIRRAPADILEQYHCHFVTGVSLLFLKHVHIFTEVRRCVHVITRTCLYNCNPLKPHFYIVKLWFTGVSIIFLFLLKNIDCGYSLEPLRRGGSNEYHNLCFEQKYEKYQNFLSEFFWL